MGGERADRVTLARRRLFVGSAIGLFVARLRFFQRDDARGRLAHGGRESRPVGRAAVAQERAAVEASALDVEEDAPHLGARAEHGLEDAIRHLGARGGQALAQREALSEERCAGFAVEASIDCAGRPAMRTISGTGSSPLMSDSSASGGPGGSAKKPKRSSPAERRRRR